MWLCGSSCGSMTSSSSTHPILLPPVSHLFDLTPFLQTNKKQKNKKRYCKSRKFTGVNVALFIPISCAQDDPRGAVAPARPAFPSTTVACRTSSGDIVSVTISATIGSGLRGVVTIIRFPIPISSPRLRTRTGLRWAILRLCFRFADGLVILRCGVVAAPAFGTVFSCRFRFVLGSGSRVGTRLCLCATTA